MSAETPTPVVDRDECFGFGFCADLLPDVFVLDDTGHATVRDADVTLALLEEAVRDCPRRAISLVLRAGSLVPGTGSGA